MFVSVIAIHRALMKSSQAFNVCSENNCYKSVSLYKFVELSIFELDDNFVFSSYFSRVSFLSNHLTTSKVNHLMFSSQLTTFMACNLNLYIRSELYIFQHRRKCYTYRDDCYCRRNDIRVSKNYLLWNF